MSAAANTRGAVVFAEAGAGRVVRLRQGGPVETVVDGLSRPEGICLSGGKLISSKRSAKC